MLLYMRTRAPVCIDDMLRPWESRVTSVIQLNKTIFMGSCYDVVIIQDSEDDLDVYKRQGKHAVSYN